MKPTYPIEYVPTGSRLSFVKLTSFNCKSAFRKALYKCTCGNEKEINIGNVKSGKVSDCGCKVKEFGINVTSHKLSKHPLFRIWSDIKTRCYNTKSWAYKYYGAKGVKMCDEWLNDFKAFYNWAISNGWEKGLNIDKDKIPKQLGVSALLYSPEYCCFLTHSENCNNKTNNHSITFDGKTMNMTQWEKYLGFPEDNIYNRLSKGWTVEEALTTPIRQRKTI